MADSIDQTEVEKIPHFENDAFELDLETIDITPFLKEEIDISELELFLKCDDNIMEPPLSSYLAEMELSSLFFYDVDEINLTDLELSCRDTFEEWLFPKCCFKAIWCPYHSGSSC